MKRAMIPTVERTKSAFQSDYRTSEKFYHLKRNEANMLGWFLKAVILGIILLLANMNLHAQSGGWDASNTNGTTGYTDHGNGVIQLLNTTNTGCASAAVHETSSTYDPASGAIFNQCYQVYFGCPDDDDIGSDQKGDGLAFSFSKCAYNINNGSCGGGLGYHGACAQMITIEFDTWSSQCNSNFDCNYGGGTSGANDEIALHINGEASDAGRVTSVNAGNLEDGLEHSVCISYNPATDVYSVTLDGNTVFSYDATGTGNELEVYFGAGGLNQTWSSGKFGATNPATVSNGSDISDNVGGPLCPANIVITSPSSGTSVGSCGGPITIAAAATPPAGNTVSYVEFFIDGVSVGTDNSDPYSVTWSNPTVGSHQITAVAYYVPGGTNSTSSAVNIAVGGGIELTSTAPTIDGTIEAFWNNYAAVSLGNELPIPSATPISGTADLSATYRTMRDAANLYILVEVTDDDIQSNGGNNWDNDGVEIFIDMGNDKPSTYGADDYQFAFVYNNPVVTEYKHNATTGVIFGQALKTGGYIIEIRIPWSTLGGSPIDSELIGFDVHVNEDDADGDSDRDAKIAWNDATDQAFNNPSVFGTIEASACNPCPSGVLSGDNTICNDGVSTSPLTIIFTGAGPWSFTYSIDGVTQPTVTNIIASPYVFQSVAGAHIYTLVSVSNSFASGCANNTSGTATISVVDFPVGHDDIFNPPGTATLSVDDMGAIYEWYDAPVGGNLVFTGSVFTTPVLSDTTTYYVQEASSATCRTEVMAIPVSSEDFFIPNLITPNSDGKNDWFHISGLPAGSLLKVFNRWGENVYHNNDYDNLWTGSGTTDGVYYFDLLLPDGTQYKGWLNIVR